MIENKQLNLNKFGIWNGKQFTIPSLKKPSRKYRIGFLTKDRIFIMHRQAKGIFRLYNGWGVNKEILNDLSQKHCREIRMFVWERNVQTGKRVLKYILTTTPDRWIQKGIPYTNEKLNNEFQLILTEANFDRKIIAGADVVE